jgi:hypothetical protein
MEGQVGKLFEGTNKPITVFYLGDHDPSGHDIERDIHQRVQVASGKKFVVMRLAIHPSDIKIYKLPPQRIKPTDSRAAGFKRRFGNKAPTVELDALPVDVRACAGGHRRTDRLGPVGPSDKSAGSRVEVHRGLCR